MAWRGLGALVGLPFAGSLTDVLDAAQVCTFVFYVDPASSFSDPVSDVGLACLRADEQTLIVLALRDTD